jgi:hypothetical protein
VRGQLLFCFLAWLFRAFLTFVFMPSRSCIYSLKCFNSDLYLAVFQGPWVASVSALSILHNCLFSGSFLSLSSTLESSFHDLYLPFFIKLRLLCRYLSLKSYQLSAIFELSTSRIKSILLTCLSKYLERSPAFWDQYDHLLLHNPFMSQFSSTLFDQYRFSQYPSIHSDDSSSESTQPDLSNSLYSEASQILKDLDPSLNRVNMASPPSPPRRLNVAELTKTLTTFNSRDSNQ